MQGIAMRLGTLVIGLEENAVLIDEIGQIFFFLGGGGLLCRSQGNARLREAPRITSERRTEAGRGEPTSTGLGGRVCVICSFPSPLTSSLRSALLHSRPAPQPLPSTAAPKRERPAALLRYKL